MRCCSSWLEYYVIFISLISFHVKHCCFAFCSIPISSWCLAFFSSHPPQTAAERDSLVRGWNNKSLAHHFYGRETQLNLWLFVAFTYKHTQSGYFVIVLLGKTKTLHMLHSKYRLFPTPSTPLCLLKCKFRTWICCLGRYLPRIIITHIKSGRLESENIIIIGVVRKFYLIVSFARIQNSLFFMWFTWSGCDDAVAIAYIWKSSIKL